MHSCLHLHCPFTAKDILTCTAAYIYLALLFKGKCTRKPSASLRWGFYGLLAGRTPGGRQSSDSPGSSRASMRVQKTSVTSHSSPTSTRSSSFPILLLPAPTKPCCPPPHLQQCVLVHREFQLFAKLSHDDNADTGRHAGMLQYFLSLGKGICCLKVSCPTCIEL